MDLAINRDFFLLTSNLYKLEGPIVPPLIENIKLIWHEFSRGVTVATTFHNISTIFGIC